MQIKLGKVVNSVSVFRKLSESELPVKLGFRVLSLLKELDEKFKMFDQSHASLVKKYGEQDSQGVKVKDENMQAFEAEMNELLLEDVEIEVPELNVDDFPASLTLTVTELARIDWAIKV